MTMRALLIVTALLLPPRPATASAIEPRVSVRADSDSVIAVAILNDVAAAVGEVASRNGFDQNAPIAGWLEMPYLASASSHPDVEVYFTKQAAYAADLSAHMDSIVTAIVQNRISSEEMRAAFMRGYNRSADRQRAMVATMGRQARIALTLHNFLVKIDAHVALNAKGDGLVFDRPKDRRRYDELAVAIDAVNTELAEAVGPPPQPAAGGAL
ncbi:MAG TPA: hypothetical protein VFN39_03750 [Gemmatimonadaceae bacterium]|nr:hypothetical protein [Gemmatimonadaceae bacterium]